MSTEKLAEMHPKKQAETCREMSWDICWEIHGGLHWKEEIKLVDVPNEKTDKEKINEVLTAP